MSSPTSAEPALLAAPLGASIEVRAMNAIDRRAAGSVPAASSASSAAPEVLRDRPQFEG